KVASRHHRSRLSQALVSDDDGFCFGQPVIHSFGNTIARKATMVKDKSKEAIDGQSDSSAETAARPDVIVEVLFEQGSFFIAVKNIGQQPALRISVEFNKKIIGLGGAKDISALALFRNIEFLGPGREIVTLVDASNSYFSRKQPTKISARVSYSDP